MIRVVIAEDQELLLDAIASLLNLEEDIEVAGRARNGGRGIGPCTPIAARRLSYGLEMPVMNGMEAAEELTFSGCKVIILTTFARAGYFQRILKADVRGYLLKDSPGEDLACSIRDIFEGKRIYSSELTEEEGVRMDRKLLPAAEAPFHNDSAAKKGNKRATVKHYFSILVEKSKGAKG